MSEQGPSDPDDLGPWAEDDLVRALRAPGTTTELADEERYVAAFRTAQRSPVSLLPRRTAGRLGAGGTAVVVTVALTGGVAAAYTGHLPDPVQTFAHRVIGAPAPPAPGRQRPEATSPHGSTSAASPTPGAPSPTGPSAGPTTGQTSSPTASPSPSAGVPGLPGVTATGDHSGPHSSQAPTGAPGDQPSGEPSTPVGTPIGSAAATTSVTAAAHRVGLGQTTVLTGVVTDSAGAAVPGLPVVLQVRGPRRWRAVVETTSDDTGTVTASTPPVLHSERFRWHAGAQVNSLPWLLRMVPALTVTADVGGATTTVTPSAAGSTPGDRLELFRRVAGRTTLLRRARLDASGSVSIEVATPRRRAAYSVRLLATKRHAAAHARVFVVPPRPSSVTITGSAGRVSDGASVEIVGTVTSATGAVLPGHRVVLLERGRVRWRPVGHAVSDSAGRVSMTTPPIDATSHFRLRTDHGAHSAGWRIVELPALNATAQRTGGTLTVTATSSGARPGDTVVLLRQAGGRLVKLRHARLGPGGSASISVRARKRTTTYVVRIVGTRSHGPASASVVVP